MADPKMMVSEPMTPLEHAAARWGGCMTCVLPFLELQDQMQAYACSSPDPERRPGRDSWSKAYARAPVLDLRPVGAAMGSWVGDWDRAPWRAQEAVQLTKFLVAAIARKDDGAVARVEAGGVNRVNDMMLALLVPKLDGDAAASVNIQACRCVTQDGVITLKCAATTMGKGVRVDARWCWKAPLWSYATPESVAVQLMTGTAAWRDGQAEPSHDLDRLVHVCTDGRDGQERVAQRLASRVGGGRGPRPNEPWSTWYHHVMFELLGPAVPMDAFTVWRAREQPFDGCVYLVVRVVHLVEAAWGAQYEPGESWPRYTDGFIRGDASRLQHARLHVVCKDWAVASQASAPNWKVVAMQPQTAESFDGTQAPGELVCSCALPRPHERQELRWSDTNIVDGLLPGM